MSTSRPNLDQAPPLPPSLQPKPQASVAGLAGDSGAQVNDSGSAALQKSVIEKMMFIEQSMQDITDVFPAAAPIMQTAAQQMRAGMTKLLMKGAQPPSAQGTPGSLIAGPPAMGGATA